MKQPYDIDLNASFLKTATLDQRDAQEATRILESKATSLRAEYMGSTGNAHGNEIPKLNADRDEIKYFTELKTYCGALQYDVNKCREGNSGAQHSPAAAAVSTTPVAVQPASALYTPAQLAVMTWEQKTEVAAGRKVKLTATQQVLASRGVTSMEQLREKMSARKQNPQD